MAAYHVVLVHFPTALWIVSALAIAIRAFSSAPLAQALDRALPLFLVLGLIFGLGTYLTGLMIWPWEAISSTPVGRNHMMFATWSMGYFALLAVLRIVHGPAVWEGLFRLIMLILAGIGFFLIGVTGTLGGHLIGIYTEVSQALRLLGWEIYTTFYVPNVTLAVLGAVSVVLLGIAAVGRKRA